MKSVFAATWRHIFQKPSLIFHEPTAKVKKFYGKIAQFSFSSIFLAICSTIDLIAAGTTEGSLHQFNTLFTSPFLSIQFNFHSIQLILIEFYSCAPQFTSVQFGSVALWAAICRPRFSNLFETNNFH